MAHVRQSPTLVCLCHDLLRARDWQHRDQLDQVRRWWHEGGLGVCSLVGIGGAGKTAIVGRFLQLLPGVTEPNVDIEKDASLPPPYALFVFSFYDAPNAEQFFDSLYHWLVRDFAVPDRRRTSKPGARVRASGSLVIDTLTNLPVPGEVTNMPNPRVLLVLDGMEKVQDDGSRGGRFGGIEDARLRRFLVRAASGWLRGISVLATTRFVPDDLEFEREHGARLYQRVDVEEIPEEACIRLLRNRGVRGGDSALRQIARECGRHALTVDLAGGYLTYFHDGDPSVPLEMPTPEELKCVADETRDRRLRYVAEQSERFAKLATRYREALSKADPPALALLERICLFRLGVAADMLATIFTGDNKEKASGPHLAQLCRDELETKLALLADMQLIERATRPVDCSVTSSDLPRPGPLSPSYSVHPAVREGFLHHFTPDSRRAGHDTIRKHLAVELGGLPSRRRTLTDSRTLDLMEEIVHHTLEAGYVAEAWDLFWCRVDPCSFMDTCGGYERVERICREFFRKCPDSSTMLVPQLSRECQGALLHTRAFCLAQLGRIAEAASLFRRFTDLGVRGCAQAGAYNLANTYLVYGHLAECRASVERARATMPLAAAIDMAALDALIAELDSLQGDTTAALARYREVLAVPLQLRERSDAFHCLRRVSFGEVLCRLGRYAEAESEVLAALQSILSLTDHQETDCSTDCHLTLAEIQLDLGHRCKSEDLVTQAQEWALGQSTQQVLCRVALLRGRIELCRATEGPPPNVLKDTSSAIEEGLRIARECGFGILHIDLLLEQARLHLLLGAAQVAEANIRTALTAGYTPRPESGLVALLPATHPECRYAWGEALGRHLLGEALLLQAAQILGRADLEPTRLNESPTELQRLVAAAREQLTRCRELRERIQDPRITETESVQRSLDDGILTKYPLVLQGTEMKDFFVSYNSADKKWAEWIAWRLEEAGYSVVIQAWDIRPGANFVLEMHNAAAGSDKTIAVLSDHYLKAEYTQPEWAAALAKDCRGQERKLIPVRVSECNLEGLLAQIVYVDLVGLCEEDARIALLGAFSERAKPPEAPAFPGTAAASRPEPPSVPPVKKEYPGEAHVASFSNSIAFVNKVVVEVARPPMSADDRLKIPQHLNSLTAQQFNMLLFALNPPSGLIPPMPAPQADRSIALLSWAESHGGCGLAKVTDFLQKITNPR